MVQTQGSPSRISIYMCWAAVISAGPRDKPVKSNTKKKISRCTWASGNPLMSAYHDEEWGVPEHDSRALWEKLMLDGFQAGLSWSIILKKRDAFRKAFKNFDPKAVARFGEKDIVRLLKNPGIVRSRAKIQATIGGARAYLAMQQSGEDFSSFVWNFVGASQFKAKGMFLRRLLSRRNYRKRSRSEDSNL